MRLLVHLNALILSRWRWTFITKLKLVSLENASIGSSSGSWQLSAWQGQCMGGERHSTVLYSDIMRSSYLACYLFLILRQVLDRYQGFRYLMCTPRTSRPVFSQVKGQRLHVEYPWISCHRSLFSCDSRGHIAHCWVHISETLHHKRDIFNIAIWYRLWLSCPPQIGRDI